MWMMYENIQMVKWSVEKPDDKKKCSEPKRKKKKLLNWKYTDVCLKTLAYKSKYAFIQYDYEKIRQNDMQKDQRKRIQFQGNQLFCHSDSIIW